MASRFEWRHQYDDAKDALARAATDITFEGEVSKTQQHHAKETDLNHIAKIYGITDGAIPPLALDPKYFGDYTDAVDFREHLDRVKNATDRFNALPAALRTQFGNDPVLLHEFVSDPANVEESVKMGLLVKRQGRPEDKPTPKPMADPPAG